MAQALVPLKDLVQAKSRLAGLLSPSERRALAQAMVEDVLAVLSAHPLINSVTLVSDDPSASLLAGKYAVTSWSEQSLGCRGLNPVVTRASERLLGQSEEPLVVLHGDLPLLTAADISEVLKYRAESGGLIVATDVAGFGTNLLAFDNASIPRFCFGANSCARHQAAASDAGLTARVLQRPGIALDVDEAEDVAKLMTALHAPEGLQLQTQTAQLLRNTTLGARIDIALATLASAREREQRGVAH